MTPTREVAADRVFDLDDVQAQYILDLRLRRLTRMSRIELEAERDDLKRRIEELERILASAQELDRVVVRTSEHRSMYSYDV